MTNQAHPFIVDYEAYLEIQSHQGDALVAILKSMREQSWHAPFWIDANMQDAGGGKTKVNLNLYPSDKKDRFTLEAYPSTDLLTKAPDQYLQLNMAQLSILLEQSVIDIYLLLNAEEALEITHEQVLVLRNQVMMLEGSAPTSMVDLDLNYVKRVNTFIDKAIAYCKANEEVHTMHASIALMGGAPAILLMQISAYDETRHAKALELMHRTIMQVGDGIIVENLSKRPSIQLKKALSSLVPMYDHQRDQGWLAKFKRRPKLEAIAVDVTE